MIGFEYYNPAKIVFGDDSEKKLADLLKDSGATSVLVVTSGDFIDDLGIQNVIDNASTQLGIPVSESREVVANPQVDLVRRLVAQAREAGVDFILAVGGGSAIDTAKAVAIGVPYDGDVWDFFDGGATPSEVLSLGVIATTASSGSETSNASIISHGDRKLGFEDDRIIPRFAIINPRFTEGLPPYQIAVGIADVLCHLLERYFSDTRHSDTTDYLIEGAIRALFINAKRLIADPSDTNARAEVQWLASVAHNNFLDAGRIADWGSHRIEHELSAQYDLVHGEGMAIVMTAWVRYVATVKPWRLALLHSRLFGSDEASDERQRAELLGDELEKFFKELGLRTHLHEVGVDDSRFTVMADYATKSGPVGHYLLLDSETIVNILNYAL